MTAAAIASSAPLTRSWMAGDRLLARSRVPDLVTKTLKVQSTTQPDGSIRRKLRLSSNLLPLLGYQPGSRFDAEQRGAAGSGIEIQFKPDGGNKIHCREYASRRARPIEAQIDIQSQQLLDAAIPAYTEAVSWHLTPTGLITITPLANRAFSIGKSLRQRRAADRLEAFVALTSGVDIALMESEGFRVIGALDWRPQEARDQRDKTETGLLNATANSQHLRYLFNEDIYAVNWAQIRERVGCVPIMHCSPQCDDFSSLKSNSARQASIENMSSVVDMVIPVLRGIEELRPAACLIENVPGYLSAQSGQILCLQLRRMGYHVTAEVLNAPDYGGLTSRKRAFIVASVFPGFAFPATQARNTTPITTLLADHMGHLPDVSQTLTMKKAIETGRARVVTSATTIAPTITKSQGRFCKDGVVVQNDEGQYLHINGAASKALMGLDSVNTSLVTGEIESEIIGQSVEGPMHSAIMRQIREHIMVATDARQMHLI